MIDTRKILSLVLVGIIAASSDCHAFKPSSGAVLRASEAEAAVVDFSDSSDEFAMNSSKTILRGGHCPEEDGRFHLHKSDVIKLHGLSAIGFSSVFFLATFGVNIPIVGSLLGPSAMVPSFNPEDAATKFFLRSILCPIWIGLGLYELEYADNAATQDIFTKYHVLINVLSVWTMKEIGGKGMQWFAPGAILLFTIASIVCK